MCGIVGIVSKVKGGFWKDQADLFGDLLYLDGVRGMDSTGAFQVTFKNHVEVAKQATNPGIFTTTETFKAFQSMMASKGKIVVGHNRKATWGDVSSKNAHPFMDKESGIVLVHNGYIQNHNDIDKNVEVDSQAIITALAKEDDPVKGIGRLFGAWAVVWYNHKRKKLYMARNSERPLAIAQTEQHMFFASEVDMLRWALSRNKTNVQSSYELLPNKVWEISTDPFEMKSFDVPPRTFRSYPSTPPPDDIPFQPDVVGDDETASCTFTLEERTEDLAIGTEMARTRARIAAMAAFDNPETQVKDVLATYPNATYVLFDVKTVVPNTDLVSPTSAVVTLIGEAWRPGSRPVSAQAVILETEDKEVYLSPEVPLLAKVEALSRRNKDMKLLLSHVQAASGTVKDIAGKKLSHEEWKMLTQFVACSSCAKPFAPSTIDFVKVKMYEGKSYEVICQDCINTHTGGGCGG
jgi:hypothetical protein